MKGRSITALCAAVSLGLATVGGGSAAAQSGYTSPFSIALDSAIGSWTTDFATRQAKIDANTSPRMADWYFPTVYSGSNYPYGPLNPQLYSSATIGSGSAVTALQYDRGAPVLNVTMNAVPGGVDPTTWQRQRILAAANVLLQAGTPYQHLHLPNFDPAQVTSGTGFPWGAVSTGTALQSSWQLANNQSGTTPNPYFAAYGKPTTGIDCTDFTAYVYNLALGIQMHSGTPNQIEFGAEPNPTVGGTATATVLDSSGNPIQPQFFYGPNFGRAVINGANSLDSLVSQFQTGDLLYIGNPHDGILHVVMWLGQNYVTASGTIPLVISSHDNTPAIFDTLDLDPTGFPSDGNIAGHLPPPGVHILPFDASNWFYQDFQVAMRVVAVPEPSAIVLALAGLAAAAVVRRRRCGRIIRGMVVSIAGCAALLASVASAQSLPSAYDLRAVASGSGTVAWVPDILDQGIFNDCWTFASATAIESNLLRNGSLGPAPTTPPRARISAWHISARNGAPESVLSTGTYGNNTVNYGWGGFEYQTMGYLTRGQGAWAIPNVPATNPQNYISTMGGGPVLISGTVNAFPHVLQNSSPANIADLLPAAGQTPAFQTRGVTFLDQGFSNNIPLPTPHGSTKIDGTWYSKYRFDRGAADPQVQAVKQAILTNGAVTTSMDANYNYFQYVANSGTAPVPYTVQYINPTELTYNTDHEVTIIGWDDTATIASATSGTSYTGAWIVQNSWGKSYWTDPNHSYRNDGTFLAPYDDPSIGRIGVAAFTMGPTAGYSPTVLQNELGPIEYASDYVAPTYVLGMAADEHKTVASVLTPDADGALVALGVATAAANTSLTIDIYSAWSGGPSGTLLASSTVALSGIGFQLIDLATPVPLVAHHGLAVRLTYGTSGAAPVVVGGDGLYGVTTGSTGLTSYPVASGLSYYRLDDGTWVDFATKLYTATSGDGSADTLGGVVFLKGIVAVPEPSTLVLVAAGVIAAAGWHGRRSGPNAARRNLSRAATFRFQDRKD